VFEDILVVDSDVTSRNTFYEVLSSMGYRVTCVPNGKEALVIIDSQIPQPDCYTTMQKMREFDSDLKFVLLTKDEPTPEVKNKALSCGALKVLKKDFTTHLMMKEILSILKESIQEIKKEFRKGSVLVVDDEVEIRNLISNFLTIKGYSVTTAASGEEALMSVRTQKPQLILCDIRMPGMDGLMVLKKILEIDPAIKVVMLTALADEDVVKEAYEEGATDYLTKPCSLKKLDALVSSILSL